MSTLPMLQRATARFTFTFNPVLPQLVQNRLGAKKKTSWIAAAHFLQLKTRYVAPLFQSTDSKKDT